MFRVFVHQVLSGSSSPLVKFGSALRSFATDASYKFITCKMVGANNDVALVQLNRPKALNSLSMELIEELISVLKSCDADQSVGAMVLTGSKKAFAAGADVKEMSTMDFPTLVKKNFIANWEDIGRIRKPIIAAVNGYALGGGCELAMTCDVIYAGEEAKFAQPEINLGIIPGGGGTQRLTRLVGKSLAMEMILSGCQISAKEAKEAGLVARVFPTDKVVEEALKLAEVIAAKSRVAVVAAKETVNAAYETALSEGLRLERHYFYSCFATKDQKEGMNAFFEKRKPKFNAS